MTQSHKVTQIQGIMPPVKSRPRKIHSYRSRTGSQVKLEARWRWTHARPGLGWGMLMARAVRPVVSGIRRQLVLEPPLGVLDQLVKCAPKGLPTFNSKINT